MLPDVSDVSDNNSKKISIVGTNNRYQIKQVTQDKIVKTRNKVLQWSINLDEIKDPNKIMADLANNINDTETHHIFKNEIITKVSGYKHQDTIKHLLDLNQFISINKVIKLLYESGLTCYYCKESIYVLYSIVREKKQWTLDRIDNDQGHNNDNVVIACLECNLQRKRKSKHSFTFTKQFVLTRDEYKSNK